MTETDSLTGTFRKEALESQSVSRPLEERMRLIAPHWWITLLAICFILCVAAVWGWYGRIYTKVSGSGMLVQAGGFRNVVSLSEGIIQVLNVSEGMPVKEGDILGALSLPLEQLELENCQKRLTSMRADLEELRNLTELHVSKRTELSARILARNDHIIEHLDELLKQLTGLNDKYQAFLSRGLVTEAEAVTVLQNMLNTAVNLSRQRQEKPTQKMGDLDYEHAFQREFWEKGREIQEAEYDLALKMAQLMTRKRIVSHSNGIIVNVEKSIGDHVAAGEAVCTLQSVAGETIRLNALIPATQGKKVKEGQTVHVSPADTEPHRIGYMVGVVEEVGHYPASMDQLVNWYKNQDLAQMLKGDEAAVTVRVELVPDPTNPTGFKWTGKAPDEVVMGPGRLCTIQVIVEERAPISYVLPYIRKTVLGYTQQPAIGQSTGG